jgi:nicotinamidase-related amidase
MADVAADAPPGPRLRLHLRSRDAAGQAVLTVRELPAAAVAVLICDMWDDHWCRAAAARVAAMAPQVDKVVAAARDLGVRVVHAPSETMAFYEGSPARARARAVPRVPPPPPLPLTDPPLPIDDSDGGCDSGERPWYRAWTRQHPAIRIDPERDVVSDDGGEIYSFLRWAGTELLTVLGVHTNMCVLGRPFGIRQMTRWGVRCALVRDLTDAMYNPARPPYVSHERGTELVVEHIERYWCPSILSADLTRPVPPGP